MRKVVLGNLCSSRNTGISKATWLLRFILGTRLSLNVDRSVVGIIMGSWCLILFLVLVEWHCWPIGVLLHTLVMVVAISVSGEMLKMRTYGMSIVYSGLMKPESSFTNASIVQTFLSRRILMVRPVVLFTMNDMSMPVFSSCSKVTR